MNYWTAHLRDEAEPVLLREGFSFAALLFGPLWLLIHGAWIPAALAFAADVAIVLLLPEPLDMAMGAGLALLLGLTGYDLRRWSIGLRGYLLVHVLAARTEAEAMGRLLASRPELAGRFMAAGKAR
jgi:hypothetical protein